MSKLLSKAIAAVAIVLFWCMTTIGSTVATMLGTAIGATTLATAITAATITPAEARRRWRGRGRARGGRYRRGRYRRGATGGVGGVPQSTGARWLPPDLGPLSAHIHDPKCLTLSTCRSSTLCVRRLGPILRLEAATFAKTRKTERCSV